MAATDLPNIRAALESRLNGVASVPSIGWENTDFDPTGINSWLRTQLEITSQKPSAVGAGAQVRHEGLFLVDAFIRYQKTQGGPNAADALAQKIQDAFPYGTILTSGGARVYIRSAERAGARIDSPWYFVPISINWYCYI